MKSHRHLFILVFATVILTLTTCTNESTDMNFVSIPPGIFMMGSDDKAPFEKPAHQVSISKGFYLQTTEVTQAQWQAVMESSPSDFKGANLPVENVSWEDAQEYIEKLNRLDPGKGYRLPTEVEWEYACRAGTKTSYYWGDEMDGSCCWYQDNSDKKTHPVGKNGLTHGGCTTCMATCGSWSRMTGMAIMKMLQITKGPG